MKPLVTNKHWSLMLGLSSVNMAIESFPGPFQAMRTWQKIETQLTAVHTLCHLSPRPDKLSGMY